MALQWRDVDLDKGVARVTWGWTRTEAGVGFDEPKTPKSRRTVELMSVVVDALRVHKNEQTKQRLAAGENYRNRDLVLTADDGQPLDSHGLIKRHFTPTLQAAGLSEEFCLYDLRHTCATLMLEAGVHPKIVSEMLGRSCSPIRLTPDTHTYAARHAGGRSRETSGHAVQMNT